MDDIQDVSAQTVDREVTV